MSMIFISSDDPEDGREIAESVARGLGYACLGRDILPAVAGRYRIPEADLMRALDQNPSFLGLSSKRRDRYLAYVQEAVLDQLEKDNIVCHGLAAHLYVRGVSHALKVRLLSDVERCTRTLASREGIPESKAKRKLDGQMKARRQWSLSAFRLDETDASYYDMVISLGQTAPERAVREIAETVAYRRFRPMSYSLQCVHDLALACRVRAALLERFPDVKVTARTGTLVIETTALKREKAARARHIKELAGTVPGVEYVEVHVHNDIFRQAAESFR
jgi:cytidylate kinase